MTPAYQEVLDRQESELREQLQLVEQLLATSLGIRGSKRADARRPELPSRRRARQHRELKKSRTGRRRLGELSEVTRQLTAALPPADLTDGPVELVLQVDGDRSTVYAVAATDQIASERVYP